MKIGVPFSQYEKAERAVVEAFGGDAETKALLWPTEEDRPEYAALTQLSFEQKTQGQRGQISAADFAEIGDDDPEEEGDHRSEPAAEVPDGTMFCPLCLGEYRRGFVECTDCRVTLKTTRAVARAARATLWKDDQKQLLEQILMALEEAEIPVHHRYLVDIVSPVKVLGIALGKNRSTSEYQIWVLKSDLQKARHAIEGLRSGDPDE
jgi:hypothetical protein